VPNCQCSADPHHGKGTHGCTAAIPAKCTRALTAMMSRGLRGERLGCSGSTQVGVNRLRTKVGHFLSCPNPRQELESVGSGRRGEGELLVRACAPPSSQPPSFSSPPTIIAAGHVGTFAVCCGVEGMGWPVFFGKLHIIHATSRCPVQRRCASWRCARPWPSQTSRPRRTP
jgi:hypothetical protein